MSKTYQISATNKANMAEKRLQCLSILCHIELQSLFVILFLEPRQMFPPLLHGLVLSINEEMP